jgi:hypothetical protein
MSLTKVPYSMISGEVINVFDYMTPIQIAATADPNNTTDVTQAIQDAMAACKSDTPGVGNTLFFPAGTFCFSELVAGFGLYTNQTIRILGSGMQKTVLKNLSATGAGLRVAGGTCTTISDLTIDMNGSSGVGFYQPGQYSVTKNIEIRNQDVTSSEYSFIVNGSSVATIENVFLSNVANGIKIGPIPTNYVTINHVIVGVTSGVAVNCEVGSNIRFKGLAIEPDDTVSATHNRFIVVDTCYQMDFQDVTIEDGYNSVLSPGEYFLIQDSFNVNFDNCRINHHGSEGRAWFGIGTNNQGVSITNSLFIDNDITLSPTYWISQSGATASYGITVKNITTSCDSLYSIQTQSNCGDVVVENWIDTDAIGYISLGSLNNKVVNTTSNVILDNANTSNVISGVSGTVTGTAVSSNVFVNLDKLKVTSSIVGPSADDTQYLGFTALRWKAVYAVNGTIQTSDEREKTEIAELSETEKAVATKLKGLIRKFKFKAAVEEKGNNARIHTGVIAQDVKAAFESEGLDPYQYGVFCYDEWEPVYEEKYENVITENGTVEKVLTGEKVLVKESGNRFGVRYDELVAFIIAAL